MTHYQIKKNTPINFKRDWRTIIIGSINRPSRICCNSIFYIFFVHFISISEKQTQTEFITIQIICPHYGLVLHVRLLDKSFTEPADLTFSLLKLILYSRSMWYMNVVMKMQCKDYSVLKKISVRLKMRETQALVYQCRVIGAPNL